MNEQPENPEPVSDKRSGIHQIKSWRGYLFEFILLFLAVFLGFVAENFRQTINEREQAEELAHNFYDELLEDSTAIRWYIDARFMKDTALIKLKNYVLDSGLERVSKGFVKNYYTGLFLNSRFEPTDVRLEQLKNSGSLVYFKSQELQRLTGSLSECIARMRQFDTYDAEYLQDQIFPFHIEHGDQAFVDRITKDGEINFGDMLGILSTNTVKIDYHINNLPNFSRRKFNNVIGLYRSRLKMVTFHHYLRYEDINKRLLALLRKEYHITK